MIFRNVREFFEPTIAALSRNGVIKSEREHPVERVYFAKVPIIKIVTAEGNIKIDISLNMTNGVQAGMIVKEYLAAMPAVRPLVMLLKSFTWRMDAHEPFNGGMGSYAITCLVISFLQVSELSSLMINQLMKTRPPSNTQKSATARSTRWKTWASCSSNSSSCTVVTSIGTRPASRSCTAGDTLTRRPRPSVK